MTVTQEIQMERERERTKYQRRRNRNESNSNPFRKIASSNSLNGWTHKRIQKSRSFIDMLLNGIYAFPEIEKLIDISLCVLP